MNLPQAKEPFRFFTRLSLTLATGLKARDMRELLEGVKSVPNSVLYTHTHRFLQQYQFLVPEPSNDFATWAEEALQDTELAEALEAVDIVSYSPIDNLRSALAEVLEKHLKKHAMPRIAPVGDEFLFMRSVRFSLPTHHTAMDLGEFHEGLMKVSLSSVYLHVFEARLRPPLGANDFSFWLETELGEKTLAKKIAGLDPYTQTLQALREKIAEMVRARIAELHA